MLFTVHRNLIGTITMLPHSIRNLCPMLHFLHLKHKHFSNLEVKDSDPLYEIIL